VQLQKDRRFFPGNPYAGREQMRICDPHLFEKRGRDSEDDFASTGDIFRDRYGVSFVKGHKGGQLACAATLSGDLWMDMSNPTYHIFSCCTQLIWELGRLRFQQQSGTQAKTKAAPEKLIDKDDDAWDSLCHFLRKFPSTVASPSPQQRAGTFKYYQQQVRRKPLANHYARV